MMAANTKDAYGRCRKLPNHLQNPHLLRYTLLTVKYTYLFRERQNNDQKRKRRPHQIFFTRSESLEHFSRAKSSFWTAKIHEIIWETHFHSSEFLIKLSLELKSVIKYPMLYTQ